MPLQKPLFTFFLVFLFLCATACSGSEGSNTDGDLRNCSSFDDSQCFSNEYCRFQDTTCGILGEIGICQEIPDNCTQEVRPVCGCDGTTYSNGCDALMNTQSILAFAACEVLSQAPESLCGANGAVACQPGSFCNFVDLSCGANNALGLCNPPRLSCDIDSAPVCGCDAVTYQNTCFAQAAGVSVDFPLVDLQESCS